MDSALHCLELISAHCLKLLNLEKLRKGPPACVWWFWYTVYLQNFHCQQWDNHYINEKKHAAGGAAPPSMALGSTTCGFTRRVGALRGGRGCGGPSCLGSRLGGLVTPITGPLGGWQAIYQVGWTTKAEIREMESDMDVGWLIGGSNIENMSGKPLKVGCSIHGFSDDLPMENRNFPMPSSINSKRIAIMISRSS